MQQYMKSALMCVFLLVAIAAPVFPQSGNGSVRGTIRDQADAVVPGVKVRLTNTATNVSSDTISNETGFYVFPVVIPGTYKLVMEASGLTKLQAQLTVQTAQSTTLDAQLKVATEATVVTVESRAPLVSADTTSLGNVLERRRIEQLPINGRNIANLLILIPGMESNSRAYGIRRGAHDFFFDGAALTDALDGAGTVTRPPGLDTVEEFKVENNSSSAKYSRVTSVIVTSRSGTNQFHGSLFETHRNNALGKARTRTDPSTLPPLIRNEYGASGGGPVFLPKLYDGRNRTFWFAAFEGSRFRRKASRLFTVPTDAMRNGDFSDLRDAQGRLINLYDPNTTDPTTWARQQFNYGGKLNAIDPARMSPLAKYIFSVIPRANLPNVNPLVAPNYLGFNTFLTNDATTTVRVDHRLTQSDQIYGRVTRGTSYRDDHSTDVPPMLDHVANYVQQPFSNLSIAVNWVHTFGPAFFNEVSLSGSRERGYIVSGDPTRDYAAELGLPNPTGEHAFPVLGTLNLGAAGNYFQPINYRARFFNFFILDDNATLVRGKHEFQFGFHARLDQLTTLPQQQQTAGLIQFDTQSTSLYNPTSSRTAPLAQPLTGHNLANMFLGVSRYAYRVAKGKYYTRQWEHAFYFQDNIRVTPRLKLYLGLRWQISPFLGEKNSVMSTFDPQRKAIVFGQDLDTLTRLGTLIPSVLNRFQQLGVKFITWKEAGLPQKLGYDNWHDIGPHLGAAYRIGSGKPEFLIRAGYQLSYHPLPVYGWSDRFRANTPFSAVFENNPNSAALSPDGISNYLLRTAPTVIAGRNSRDAIQLANPTGLVAGSAEAYYWNPNYPTSRVHDWNVTLEKQFMRDTVVRASMVGNHARYQDMYVDYNAGMPAYIWYVTQRRPLPTGPLAGVLTRPFDQTVYGPIQEFGKFGWGNYSGARLELERRYSKGVGFQVFYVVGNTLSTLTGGTGGWDGGQMLHTNQFLPGAVPTDLEDRARLLHYKRDDTSPKHRLRWNWIVDLPFGKGRWLGHNSGGIVNKFISGWQLAGSGTVRSNYFALPTSIYPAGGNPIEVYGKKYKIQDCRSGTCFPGYLWWNGYIPANQINSVDAQGRPNGIMGVPDNYKPAGKPLIPWGTTTAPENFPSGATLSQFWDTNTVWLRLDNGTTQQVTFNDNMHPWRNQYMPGVWEFGQDVSLFKEVQIREALRVRLNIDAFNVFNNPGIPIGVGSNGLVSTRESRKASRELQFTLRVTW
ncbi:MAG TPA: carboxypeptidase-like regulatory domain-containing protein [Acidobacteriota bacterium]